jgi:5-methylcytosine-specific restriction endonuclease McrA
MSLRSLLLPASLPMAGAMLLATLLGALAGRPLGENVYRYTWTDARFCDDCHVHDYANEAWAQSVHGGVTSCHDCHRVPIRHYPRNLWKALFDRPQGPDDIHAPHVPIVVCSQCHSEAGADEPLTGPMSDRVRAQVGKVDGSTLHDIHLRAESRVPPPLFGGTRTAARPDDEAKAQAEDSVITCMDCHGAENNRAHRFAGTDTNCLRCHEGLHREGRLARLSCRECHFAGFEATRLEGTP